MHFEDTGLFIGFISYPFYKDGKELYRDIFKPFFEAHRSQISLYDPDIDHNSDMDHNPYEKLYSPAGYRLFGSKGLAILSLVDDYSFYSRFFNKNHIQTLLPQGETIDYDFNSEVISGIVEVDDSMGSLAEVASNTFLRPTITRYRYIGIIRLKIDNRILLGANKGINTIRSIKEGIKNKFRDCKKGKEIEGDYVAVDCYDNDEMSVVAFSDDLMFLYNFLGEIRSIKRNDIGYENKDGGERHVFGLAYLCFGYDVEFDLSKDENITKFELDCIVEPKPGHRDSFYKSVKNSESGCSFESGNADKGVLSELGISNSSINISGGCSVYFRMPLFKLPELEKLCRNEKSIIRRDARNVKVSLKDIIGEGRISNEITPAHVQTENKNEVKLDRGLFGEIKNNMKKIGASKMVRERLLALMEFYNASCEDLLHRPYMEELRPSFIAFGLLLKELPLEEGISLNAIENILNTEISNLENACHDRLHARNDGVSPLEYSGGIQQYLTAFDNVYKTISSTFNPGKDQDIYVTISSAERASSERMLFNLNINDVIFPELFVTTVWKEIANFMIKTKKRYDKDICTNKGFDSEEECALLARWNEFTNNPYCFSTIRSAINDSESLIDNDDIIVRIKSMIDSELLEYFFKDYFVYHFAFARDFYSFYHFYMKTMLQTSTCYRKLNVFDKNKLIHMMMRVFVIGKMDGIDAGSESPFNDLKETVPYESQLGGLWLECFEKTKAATMAIFDVIERFDFSKTADMLIEFNEANIARMDGIGDYCNISDIVRVRREKIDKMTACFSKGELIERRSFDLGEINFVICLLNSYIQSIYVLDMGTNDSPSVKSLPRNSMGEVSELMERKTHSEYPYTDMLNILADSTGGFFVPSLKIRKEYFKQRTVLYKSLWHYRFDKVLKKQ